MARKWLALDLRSLGLLRICIAFCLLTDLFFRSFHLVAHYTSLGFLPLRNYISLILPFSSPYFSFSTPRSLSD